MTRSLPGPNWNSGVKGSGTRCLLCRQRPSQELPEPRESLSHVQASKGEPPRLHDCTVSIYVVKGAPPTQHEEPSSFWEFLLRKQPLKEHRRSCEKLESV